MYKSGGNTNQSGKKQEPKKPFINPYNFVPFEKNINRVSREEAYQKKGELLSGWLTVELQTKTPLIIPDGAHTRYWDLEKQKYISEREAEVIGKENTHKEYEFFKILNENGEKIPAIPGSELRGMLRSVYEAVTDSCVPFLLDEKPISRRVPVYGALHDRGLLTYDNKKNQWTLFKARINKSLEVSKIEVKDGKVYTDGELFQYKNGEFVEDSGWVQYNIPVSRPDQKYYIVYLQEEETLKIWDEGDDEPYRKLKSALERDGATKKKTANEIPNRNLQKALEKAKNGGNNMVPVYYIKVTHGEETLVYLSNSSIGRIAQKRKWEDIMGDYTPCKNTDAMCPACLLFGTTQGNGMKGRLQITDATPVLDNLETPKVHRLQILGSPNPSAFEFYFRKPSTRATYWNADFYGESEKVRSKDGKEKTKINYFDLEEATPRGRKMYWHSKIAEDAEKKEKMNCTVESVNGTFKFKIYFNEITNQQLENLLWVITLGENKEDSTRQHKLGHGRPLGYGSVKLQVLEQTIRQVFYDKESGRMEVTLESKTQKELQILPRLDPDSEAEKNLLIMVNTESFPKDVPVMYPREKKGREDNIYTWFAQNRRNSDSVRTLPEPTEITDTKKMLMGNWSEGHPMDCRKEDSEERIYGKIKFYKMEENYGFITDETGKDCYIRWNQKYHPDIKKEDLIEGKKVSFILKKFADGKKVANKCRLEE